MSRHWLLPIIALLVLGLVGMTVSKHIMSRRQAAVQKEAAEEEVATAVRVVQARTGTVEKSFVVTGTVEADVEVGVHAKMPGKVMRINFDEGDWVPKGALVAELERDEIVAQVNQAKAAVKAAEVRLRQAREGYKLQQASTQTSVEQAEAALATAKARLAQAETGVQLTDEDVATTVAAAEQAVRMAQARLDALKAGARKQERQIAQEQVRQAKANMETAKRDLERGRKLLEAQAISQQQFDALQLRFDVAAAQYKAALQQASLVEEGPREEEIRAAEAQLQQAKAQLEKAKALQLQLELRKRDLEAAREGVRQADAALKLAKASRVRDKISAEDIKAAEAGVAQAKATLAFAQAQLRNTYIYAPASGYVVQRTIDPGEVTSPSVPILVLVDNRNVKVRCALSEERRRLVRVGQRVQVEVDALPGRKFTGVVQTISAAADPQSRSFSMEVRVHNPQRLLKAGMFARVKVVYERREGVVVIPYDAVLKRNGKDFCFVVSDGIARIRELKLGPRQEEMVAILSGLKPGEQVVVQGQTELKDGQRVAAQQVGGEAR